MKYLFDTSAIVDHLRGKKGLEASILEKGCAISIITQAELFYGAYKSDHPQKSLVKVKQMFEDLMIEVLPLDEGTLKIYGKTKVRLERKGQRLDEFDLLIAATALSLNLALVTSNVKHFQTIPSLKFFQ